MLELKKISKSYVTGSFKQVALNDIDLKFRESEFVAILGPSGSGKTTLLNIIGGLDRYDIGDLIINGRSTKVFKDRDWDSYRNSSIGFIFQNYNLIPHISILANVEMGMALSGVNFKKRHKKALEVLEKVGLREHVHKKPSELSGGQMQRVAIARALANDPSIILADEPTGALDSKTSIQIMDLIREIAKDKLVIMVTHNESLANNYASRIIKMQDGKIISDSKIVREENKEDNSYKIKKTRMNFYEALKLSLNNIKTKKGRSFLTAFASSIGIIGIALILSLSNGFNKQIAIFERNTLSNLPIVISEDATSLESEDTDILSSEDDYPDYQYITPLKTNDTTTHKNTISQDYIDYINKASSDYVSGISMYYYTNLNLLTKNSDSVKIASTYNFGSIPKKLDEDKSSVINDLYDVLAGKEATGVNEMVLVVDSKNQVSEDILDTLGLDKNQDKITFEELLNTEVKLILNDDFYTNVGNYYVINSDLDKLYDSDKALTLKLVGIVRLKEDYPGFIQDSVLLYTEDLINYVISLNKDSKIVNSQKEADYNLLTGEAFDLNTVEGREFKDLTLAYLGSESLPYTIGIYPTDFEAKDALIAYLDQYNENKEENEQITYTDQAELIASLSSGIMDAITVVLVAFSSISLIVSSIMIGIIMYISVLERTKEIGILRSLGARKKDISRIFKAETFIIGFTSGLIGILITWVLLIPINKLLYDLTNLKRVAVLNPIHAIILIIISLILTLIGGMIPARIASKKDPVIALRTE